MYHTLEFPATIIFKEASETSIQGPLPAFDRMKALI